MATIKYHRKQIGNEKWEDSMVAEINANYEESCQTTRINLNPFFRLHTAHAVGLQALIACL